MRFLGGCALGVALWGTGGGCSDPVAPPTGGSGKLGSACSSDAQCGTGMYCPGVSSLYEGMCTKDCSTDGECSTAFGRTAFCGSSGFCLQACASAADCKGGHCESISGAFPDFCKPGAATLSQACTESSQCAPGLMCGDIELGIGGCSKPCTLDTECDTPGEQIGNGCASGRCVMRCEYEDECRAGTRCSFSGESYSHCIPD
jgi:hypothetical protein